MLCRDLHLRQNGAEQERGFLFRTTVVASLQEKANNHQKKGSNIVFSVVALEP